MTTDLKNIGEGIAIFGVMVGVGLTRNYWLLLALTLPCLTWMRMNTDLQKKFNDLAESKESLELDKLREEIRLLKARKK